MIDHEPQFAGIVHGIRAPVVAPEAAARARGDSGIAVSRMLVEGEHRFVITTRHEDGTLLSCILDEGALDKFAHNFAAAIEAANALDNAIVAQSAAETLQ